MPIPPVVVAAMTESLCLDLDQAWAMNKCGGLTERLFAIFSREELAKMARELKVTIQPGWNKDSVTAAFGRQPKLPMPKALKQAIGRMAKPSEKQSNPKGS